MSSFEKYLQSICPIDINSDEFTNIMWEWTSAPFLNKREVLKQLSKYIRATNNNRRICWCCGMDEFHHRYFCDGTHPLSPGKWEEKKNDV